MLLAGTEPGNFTCTLPIVAYTDPALDPFEVSAERYLSFQCVRFDWEKAYYDKLDHCYAWVNDIVHVPGVHIHVDPGDPPSYQVRPEDLGQLLRYERALHFLQKKQPARAQEFVSYLVQRFTVPMQTILKRMERQKSSAQEQSAEAD